MGKNQNSVVVLRLSPKSPQREVVRSSAGVCILHPPPLFGGSFAQHTPGHDIGCPPFCQIVVLAQQNNPPMDFLIVRPPSPETGHQIFGRGWGRGNGFGGWWSKVYAQQDLNRCQVAQSSSWLAGNPTADVVVGGECITMIAGFWYASGSPPLVAESATTKAQTVCFWLPVCLPACPTDCMSN